MTRSANWVTGDYPFGDSRKEFRFTAGDPDIAGNLTRIKISVCHFWGTAKQGCKTTTYSG